jgi:DNA-directed RNA polymerase beta subunit
MYTLDPYTSEDAAVVRKGFIEEFNTIETEVISIKMNSNDFLINLRGKNGEYKPLPDIGEKVTGILASIRTQFNNQVLYDFKSDSLSRIQDGDRTVYINGTQEVVDITIYSNNEEIKDDAFNEQINKYLVSQNKYYKEVYDTCKEIIESGFDYTKEIDYLFKRSKEMLDTEKRWKEGDAAFSNMIIEITTRKVKPLANGQKITGRYGNKSVISQIREDDDMPFTEDGRHVDVLLNLLAIINRTTSFAIFELAINAITYQTRKRMKTLKTYKEKEILLFDIVHDFNEEQYALMKKEYDKLDSDSQKKIIDDAIEYGIFIHQSPTHETKPLFYRIKDILEKNEWLQPENIYVNMNGRKIKTMSKHWLGQMYLLKLKQSDLRGFSARSTGAIDIKGLPTRSYKSRNHMEKHSDSAIRFFKFVGAEILVIKFSKTFLIAGTSL